MIQLGKFVGGGVVVWWGGGVVGWLTPTTYIQLTGAGSKVTDFTENQHTSPSPNIYPYSSEVYNLSSAKQSSNEIVHQTFTQILLKFIVYLRYLQTHNLFLHTINIRQKSKL